MSDMGAAFPHRKELPEGRFAYIVALTFQRARINVSRSDDPFGVTDFY